MKTAIEDFYRRHLADGSEKNDTLTATCPFCTTAGPQDGKIVVFLNRKSFFFGYFRCKCSCMEHGFAHWFAALLGVPDDGLEPVASDELFLSKGEFPRQDINAEIKSSMLKLQQEELFFFRQAGISKQVLQQTKIGYNGRYIVYPYEQRDANIYSARCVHPDREEDFFWHGNVEFASGETGLFNFSDLRRCAGGALFLCEGETNLLAIRQLGFPGVAYWDSQILDDLDVRFFDSLKTVFLLPGKKDGSAMAARQLATRIGHKVRILSWSREKADGYGPYQCAVDMGAAFAQEIGKMMNDARPFSPFVSPESEKTFFLNSLIASGGEEYRRLKSGFDLLDSRLDGIHGINILGGGPKVGKSCFMMQIASSLAAQKIPVLYYDFENGRQRIYQRTFIRLSRIEGKMLGALEHLDHATQRIYEQKQMEFGEILRYFRVINDRKVSPESMRRHIDFLRHETRNDYVVVVIDSLHKLPFKDLAEMRTGIDSWLREIEAIRDSLQVSFLVISELQRGAGGAYDDAPHMGIFKGSGDIEYSADNAMVMLSEWDHMQNIDERKNALWLVGSREHSPGLVARYVLDYPFWGFREEAAEISE